tara:strand:+ start:713 stop:1702 length:990 start_codon:yes stop_codon:yes gene_type:complete
MASFHDQWGYEKYKIFTNNFGFKDKSNREVKFKKRNILFIGDSFTEGVGIKYEDTFVGIIDNKLKKIYNNVEVLNAGVQSYSTSIYLSKIHYLLKIKKLPITDIVIVVSGGDIFDDAFKYLEVDEDYILNHVDHKNKIMIKLINFIKSNTIIYQIISRITPPKVIPSLVKSLFEKQDDIKSYEMKEKELKKISNEDILKMNFLNHKDYSYLFSNKEFDDWGKKSIDSSIENLKKITELTNKNNINLNILYIYEPIIILRDPNKQMFSYLINSFKSLENHNANFFALSDFYKQYDNKFDAYKSLFFINDIHLNKQGNSLVANEIIAKLKL